MRLACLQDNLSRGLGIVSRAVATRTTLPVTNNILLTTEQSRLKLAATNLEIAIITWVGANVEEDGAITIPSRLFTELVNSLPNDKVDMELAQTTLKLKCGRFESHISGIDAEDFPPIPTIGDGIDTQIEPEALHLAINQVVFATASEDTRPVLTGVSAEFDEANLTLAAADGFRLAVHKTALLTPVAEKIEIIIPSRSLIELNRLLADQDEAVKVSINPNRSQIAFKLKDTEVVSQLLQGAFPNYRQLIPQSYTTRTVFNTSEFLKAVKIAAIFARDSSGIIRFEITPAEGLTAGKANISSRSEQLGDNLGELDALVDGEAAKIAFNGKYLIDLLGVLKEEKVVLETTSPSSPGVIRPLGTVDNYVHVIMPMFVQWS
jgi:DNA polymerase-3 subunit beta